MLLIIPLLLQLLEDLEPHLFLLDPGDANIDTSKGRKIQQ